MGKVSNEKGLVVHLENHLVFSKAVNGFIIHFHTWYVNLLTVMLCTNLILAYITNQTRLWLFITGTTHFPSIRSHTSSSRPGLTQLNMYV